MMFGWTVGLILVIFLLIALGKSGIFQQNMNTTATSDKNSSAMETLKNRYAKGEIDEEEFERKKAELEKHG